MKFVTAQQATRDSIEKALDEAFAAVMRQMDRQPLPPVSAVVH